MHLSKRWLAPKTIARTGDDSPAPNVWRYTMRMTGWHQLIVCAIAVCVALVHLIPIELQRRIVDDAIVGKDTDLLIALGIVYGAVLLGHQALNYLLRMLQGWLSESAIRYTRQHLLEIYGSRPDVAEDEQGKAVSIISTEAEKLGGFVGETLSQACVNATLLLGVAGYMFIVEPTIAVVALALLLPQVVVTPILQTKLNRLIAIRLGKLRELSNQVALGSSQLDGKQNERVLRGIYDNRITFYFWKFLMKMSLNLLNGFAPLIVLIWGGVLVISGETTVGVLVAFLSGFERISQPLRELIKFYRTAAQAEVQHKMIARWM